MHRILLLLVLICSCSFLHAQNQQAEAKAAYLLAEEQFNAGKYEDAVSYLDLAAEKLGTANAKILYLKVMALLSLSEKDDKHIPRLKEAVLAFGKAPDLDGFNEEKQLEIVKLKLKLEKEGSMLAPEEDLTPIFIKYQPDGWLLGITIDEARSRKPDFFAKAGKGTSADGTTISYNWHDSQTGKYTFASFRKGKLSHVQITLMPSNEDKNFTRGKQLMNSWMSWFKGTPVTTTNVTSEKSSEITNTNHTWKDGKVTAILSYSEHKMNFGMGSKAYSSAVSAIVSTHY